MIRIAIALSIHPQPSAIERERMSKLLKPETLIWWVLTRRLEAEITRLAHGGHCSLIFFAEWMEHGPSGRNVIFDSCLHDVPPAFPDLNEEPFH
jgi:hypothetical protein